MVKPAFMQYRLLRNNKESGPFTKAQLEEMGLKPYDLLWLEGRGGAWQYASEINDLKSIAPVVEEQPYDRFYKGKEKQTTDKKENQIADKPNTSNTTISNPSGFKTQKPRFRISGDKIIMVDSNAALPQAKPVEAIVVEAKKTEPVSTEKVLVNDNKENVVLESAKPDWKEMYTEWKGDESVPEPVIAAAPTQTFEEIKQRYEENKLKQTEERTKVSSATKQNIMAAAAIIVLALGGYAGYRMNQQNENSPAGGKEKTVIEKAEIIPDEPKSLSDSVSLNQPVSVPVATPAPATNDIVKQDSSNEIKSTISSAAPAIKKPADSLFNKEKNAAVAKDVKTPEIKKTTVAPVKTKVVNTANTALATATKPTLTGAKTTDNKQNAAVPLIVKKTDVPAQVKSKATDADLNNIQKANTAAPVQIPTASQTTTVKQIAPKKRIGDYVTINKVGNSSSAASVQDVQLSVKNITDFPIDLAVVDIQYYGANGRYQKGETMYVKNIASGDNINVRVPDSKTAKSISYKISLISAEQKTLYLVGD